MKQTIVFKLVGSVFDFFRQSSIFQSFSYLIEGKSNLLLSIGIGGFMAKIASYIQTNTPSEVFGCSLTLWAVVMAVNTLDWYTGIKADVHVQRLNGLKWKFKPDKGYKAFEKIIGFTVMIWFLYTFEKEAVRLEYYPIWAETLNYSKFILFFYVVLIELKSIGNNNETRFGKKDEMFKMLDSIIFIVNDGILTRLKKIFGISKTDNNE